MAAFDLRHYVRSQAEGKAIVNHPSLRGGQVPATVYAPGQSVATETKLSQHEAVRHLDAYGGSQAIDWVMDATDYYAHSASQADWNFKKKGKVVYVEQSVDTPEGAEIAPPELVELLRKPNPFMLWDELVELLVIDLLLVGNAYWYKYDSDGRGRPSALYRLTPPAVKIIAGKLGPRRYEYQPDGAKDPMQIDPKDVVHFKRPNPHSAFYGIGIIKGGGRPLDLELAVTESQASYYENRADPSLIVQSERRVPRDVFNKLKAQVRARASGPRKSGEILLLEAGLKASSISTTARDAMFAEIGDKSRDRILAMFRLHPKLLQLPDDSPDKLADIRREFDMKTMKPFLKKLSNKIGNDLTQAWDLDFSINYHYVMPQEEIVRLGGDIATIPGMKVREIRRFLMPLGIMDGESTGDAEIDEMVLNLPGEEADEDGEAVAGDDRFADQPIGSEPGRPPTPGNTRAFPRAGGTPPRGNKVRRPSGKALLGFEEIAERLEALGAEGKALPRFEPQPRSGVGVKLTGEKRPADPHEPARDADLDAVIGAGVPEILQAVHVLERTLLDHSEGKAFDPKTLARRIRNSDAWKTFAKMLTDALEAVAARAVSTAAIHERSAGAEPELDYDAIASEVANRPDGVRSITDNLKALIVDKVIAEMDAGNARPEVDEAIRTTLDTWRNSKAETVALDTAVHAYNEGTLSIAEGEGEGDVLVSDGRDHDEPCIAADGDVWPIAYARAHRSQHPRCRRAFIRLAGGPVG